VQHRVEVHGLEVFGHHGAEEEERRRGQVFLVDVDMDVGDAGQSDRIEDAVDYRLVAARVAEISAGRTFNLLEAFAASLADAILAGFPVAAVEVRVRKRPADMAVEWTAASALRSRS
jgi:dihydroneopterin aldolase